MHTNTITVFLAATLGAVSPTRAQSAPSPRPAKVCGRCVLADTRAPVAGAKVSLDGFEANAERMAKHGPVVWKDPAPVMTDAEGRFEIRFVPPPPYQFGLDIRFEGHVPRTGRWSGIEFGQVIDLGEITLAKGYMVPGKVVDQQGAPVAKAMVGVKNLPLPIDSTMAANNERSGASDQNGEFVVSVPIPAGTWSIDVQGRGIKHVGPDVVRVREGRGAEPLTVTVKTMPTIEGIVVDEKGVPVEGVSLGVPIRRSGLSPAARTGRDGKFVFHAVDDEAEPIAIEVSEPGPCEPWQSPGSYAWGSKDLRLQITRTLTFELTVVEQGTGRPVTGYAVRCHPADARNSMQRDLRLGGQHPDGRVAVDRVARGDNLLIVVPSDPALDSSPPIEVPAAGEGIAPLRVELPRRVAVPIVVRKKDGTPVAGSLVELCEPREGTVTLERQVPEESQVMTSDPRGYHGPRLLGKAATDARGRVMLFAPKQSSELVIRVLGPGHAPALAQLGNRADGQEAYAVAVAPGATIEGRLGPESMLAWKPILHVRRENGFAPPRLTFDPPAVGPDGTFSIRDLEAGTWTITPAIQYQVRFETSASGTAIPLLGCEQRIEVAEGGKATVKLDASQWLPATLAGIVTLDDKAPDQARVLLLGKRGTQSWQCGAFVPDATGCFEAPSILPGTYKLQVIVGDFRAREGQRIEAEDVVEVAPGKTVRHEFRIRRP